MTGNEILSALANERARQRGKWNGNAGHMWGKGDCSSHAVPMVVKAAVLAEEAGEVVKAVLNAGPVAAVSDDQVKVETIQTLAVAWAILEGM